MCKIQGQKSSAVARNTGQDLLTGSPTEGQAEPFSGRGGGGRLGRAFLWSWWDACICLEKEVLGDDWLVRKARLLYSHMACCFVRLLITWYLPVASSAMVLFLDRKSLSSTGVESMGGRGMAKEFKTLLPKQPFKQSVCLAQSSLVSRKFLVLPIPKLFEGFKIRFLSFSPE